VFAIDPPLSSHCSIRARGFEVVRLVLAYDADGTDSLDHAYRALRQRYYGSAAYDFGEVPLSDVADVLVARSNCFNNSDEGRRTEPISFLVFQCCFRCSRCFRVSQFRGVAAAQCVSVYRFRGVAAAQCVSAYMK